MIAGESDFIQSELCKTQTSFIRNNRISYYDCTNYYFLRIEEEDDFRRYGKSKENRPNPIVTMGLFMDAETVFTYLTSSLEGQHKSRCTESQILQDFNYSEFIYCSDSGLGSSSNRRFNSLGNRAYIITHSLKKMKKEDREIALNPTQFRRIGSDQFIDIRTLDESDEEVYNTIYYKEVPVVTGDMDETLVVTYSPKYKAYQRKIRARQIERAERIITAPRRKRKGKNQNDPMRFVKKTSVTTDGEIAEKQVYDLDEEQIQKEELYDGFYAVITNRRDILDHMINRQRWEIEENFDHETEFSARLHICQKRRLDKSPFQDLPYQPSLLYRLLKGTWKYLYSRSDIETLRSMQMTLLNTASGYILLYKKLN